MWLSIVVYSSLALVLFVLAWHAHVREQRLTVGHGINSSHQIEWELILSVALIAIVSGARYGTGFDHLAYMWNYLRLCDAGDFIRHNYEPGFVLVAKFFAACHAHYFFFFAFWAGLQFGLLYYAMRHHKFLLPWLALYIIIGPYLIHSLNAIRQGVVECGVVFMIPMIQQRRIVPYMLTALVLMTIHSVSLLLIPLYFIGILPHWDGWKRYPRVSSILTSRWTHLVIFGLCFAVGCFPEFVANALTLTMSFIERINPFSAHYEHFIEILNGHYEHYSFSPTRMAFTIVYVSIILLYPKVREWKSTDKLLPIIYLFAFIYMCTLRLFMNMTYLILRPVDLLFAAFAVMFAYTMAYLWATRRFVVLAYMFVVQFTYIYLAIYRTIILPTAQNKPVLFDFFFLH